MSEELQKMAEQDPHVDRMIGVVQLYHQAFNEDAIEEDCRWAVFLQGQEQPYIRKLKVTSEKQRVNLGWLKDASMLFIRNVTGQKRQTKPTPEEIEALKLQVLCVRYDADVAGRGWFVRPGLPLLGEASAPGDLLMWSLGGTLDIILVAIPV